MTTIINIIININLYKSYIERRFAEIAIRVAMKIDVNQISIVTTVVRLLILILLLFFLILYR